MKDNSFFVQRELQIRTAFSIAEKKTKIKLKYDDIQPKDYSSSSKSSSSARISAAKASQSLAEASKLIPIPVLE